MGIISHYGGPLYHTHSRLSMDNLVFSGDFSSEFSVFYKNQAVAPWVQQPFLMKLTVWQIRIHGTVGHLKSAERTPAHQAEF